MAFWHRLIPALEARRRWHLPEPEHYDVVVRPTDTLAGLMAQTGFKRVQYDMGFCAGPREKRPLAEIYQPWRGVSYTGRFELLQLADVPDLEECMREVGIMSYDPDYKSPYCHLIGLEKALAKLASRGYEPASAHEFLAFLAQYPCRNRLPRDIFALGAVHREHDRIHVLGIHDRPEKRELNLTLQLRSGRSHGHAWLWFARFLAKKIAP